VMGCKKGWTAVMFRPLGRASFLFASLFAIILLVSGKQLRASTFTPGEMVELRRAGAGPWRPCIVVDASSRSSIRLRCTKSPITGGDRSAAEFVVPRNSRHVRKVMIQAPQAPRPPIFVTSSPPGSPR
jgi:hypothetical protein